MHDSLTEMLECPTCHGRLRWQVAEVARGRSESEEASSTACSATYPPREGIGVFLAHDLPRHDLWHEVESGLAQHLCQHALGPP